jgi:hypothetical protein
MACCKCCCGNVDCAEGQEGKCCCGGVEGACCQVGEYCCDGVCKAGPCCEENEDCPEGQECIDGACQCPCPDCSSEPANCNFQNYICMNWSATLCAENDFSPDGLITGPLELIYDVFGNKWVFSSPTAFGEVYCEDGDWKFAYYNGDFRGTWSVVGVLGSACDIGCDLDDVEAEGTATFDVNTAFFPTVNCQGQAPVSLSISTGTCGSCL